MLALLVGGYLTPSATDPVGWAAPGETSASAVPATPAAPPAERPGHQLHPPASAYVVMGLAGASVIVGAVFGIKALRDKRDFDQGDKTTDRVEAIEKNALLADMAFGAAIALGVTGVVLWLSRDDGEVAGSGGAPDAPVVGFAPLVSRSGAGATALFRF